jgi:MoaA/NifB/PqqE/SkfB family radical SAM enzyme
MTTNQSRLKQTNFAAFENFLMAKYERLAGLTQTRSYPYVMTMDPTNICQLRCPTCYTGIANERAKTQGVKNTTRRMTRLARDFVDSILDECGDVLFYCNFFNWGEPLLNDSLPEYIRAASARNIYTKVDSNLSLRLSDARLEALLRSGLSELSASIDGFSQATYEQYRRGGRLSLVLENLTRLAAMRERTGAETKITWAFLVFSFNEHEIPAITAFCERHAIEFLPRNPVVIRGQSDWLPAYRREGKPNPHLAAQSPSDWMSPAGVIPLHLGRPEGRSCAWHYGYAVVHADGGVLPCCGLYPNASDFGNVGEGTGAFRDIWNNDHFATVRRVFPNRETAPAGSPAKVCAECGRSETMLNKYAALDREIVRHYWGLPEGSDARQLDELFVLLQTSPDAFAAAYGKRYDEAAERKAGAVRGSTVGAALG